VRRALPAGVALLAAVAVLYLQGLGHSPLLEPDEGRYASIPREMLASGDWVVPRLNGVVYAQKPPLGYWLTAVAFRLAGVGEESARLAPALSAIATVGVAAWFGVRAFGPAAGIAGAAMLATMPLFFLFGRLAILDMPLTLFLTLAIVCLYRAAEDGRRRWPVGAALAVGAAVMTKGLVGVVLPAGIVVVAALVEHDRRLVTRALVPLAAGTLLAVPWFLLLEARVPGALEFLIVRHHLARYAVGGKIGHAHFPGFLLPVLLGGALPWTLVLAAGLWHDGLGAWRDPSRRAERFCDVWALVILAFFSLSRLQIPTYVCPVFVPLALRTGRLWAAGAVGRRPLAVWAGLAAAVLVLALVPEAAYRALFAPLLYRRWWSQAMAFRALLAPAAAIVLCGTAAALALGRRGLGLAALAGTLAVGLALAERVRPAFPSYAALGTIVRSRSAEADDLVTVGRFLQGLPFYARRPTALVGSAGPLDFGAERPEGRDVLWREGRLVKAWNDGRRIFLVVRPRDWRRLRPRLVRPANVLAAEHGRVLVSNAPLGVLLPP
jgi:4-amino-4-deoxy-L-arabinose transferase-like glycosyltransferase